MEGGSGGGEGGATQLTGMPHVLLAMLTRSLVLSRSCPGVSIKYSQLAHKQLSACRSFKESQQRPRTQGDHCFQSFPDSEMQLYMAVPSCMATPSRLQTRSRLCAPSGSGGKGGSGGGGCGGASGGEGGGGLRRSGSSWGIHVNLRAR